MLVKFLRKLTLHVFVKGLKIEQCKYLRTMEYRICEFRLLI